jgi:hypothetical protein
MTWNRLLDDWRNYLEAMVETPYDPDRVQALGMRFADAWNYHKGPICYMLDERVDEFDYAKWRSFMPRMARLLALMLPPRGDDAS